MKLSKMIKKLKKCQEELKNCGDVEMFVVDKDGRHREVKNATINSVYGKNDLHVKSYIGIYL